MLCSITHDDAITVAAAQGMRSILDAHTNNNGCDHLPATFFVLKQDTDCELARKLWEEGNEVRAYGVCVRGRSRGASHMCRGAGRSCGCKPKRWRARDASTERPPCACPHRPAPRSWPSTPPLTCL